MAASAHPTIIFGAMELGRRADEATSHTLIERFLQAGYNQIDTALMYSGGKSETILGSRPQYRDSSQVSIATKANPFTADFGKLSKEGVKKQLQVSLKRLNRKVVEIFYLHAPDHGTPIEETLQAVQEEYEQGKFKELGLSNYAAWQVAEIYYIMDKNGWVKPTIYQGMYNALTRSVEAELFPCLRRFGIRFVAYNPLAGGVLAGKHKFSDITEQEKGSKGPGRFSGNSKWSKAYRKRFWKKENFDAVEKVKQALSELDEDVSMAAASLRWMFFHSKLSAATNDGVILGFSTLDHFSENMEAVKGGPLPKAVVDEFDAAWNSAKSDIPLYHR